MRLPQVYLKCKDCVSLKHFPGAPSDHPHSPCPARRGVHTYVVCGCCRAVQQPEQTQIVPNSFSLYTLFYSVIYNSVGTHMGRTFSQIEVWLFFKIYFWNDVLRPFYEKPFSIFLPVLRTLELPSFKPIWAKLAQNIKMPEELPDSLFLYSDSPSWHQRIFMYKELTAAPSSLLHLSFAVESRKL